MRTHRNVRQHRYRDTPISVAHHAAAEARRAIAAQSNPSLAEARAANAANRLAQKARLAARRRARTSSQPQPTERQS